MPFWRCCRYLRGKDKQSDIERWSPKLQLSCFPWFSEQSCCFGTRWTGIKSSSSRQTHCAIYKLDNIVDAVSGYSHGWTDCTAGAEVAALGHFHAYCQCGWCLVAREVPGKVSHVIHTHQYPQHSTHFNFPITSISQRWYSLTLHFTMTHLRKKSTCHNAF